MNKLIMNNEQQGKTVEERERARARARAREKRARARGERAREREEREGRENRGTGRVRLRGQEREERQLAREEGESKREKRKRDFITYRDRSGWCSVGKDGADVSVANDRLLRAHPLARPPSQVEKKQSERYLGLRGQICSSMQCYDNRDVCSSM